MRSYIAVSERARAPKLVSAVVAALSKKAAVASAIKVDRKQHWRFAMRHYIALNKVVPRSCLSEIAEAFQHQRIDSYAIWVGWRTLWEIGTSLLKRFEAIDSITRFLRYRIRRPCWQEYDTRCAQSAGGSFRNVGRGSQALSTQQRSVCGPNQHLPRLQEHSAG